MNDDNNGINYKINVTENLVATFQKINRAVDKTINNLKKLDDLSLDKLNNDFNKINNTVDKTGLAISNSFSSVNSSIDKTINKLSEMGNAVNDSSAPFFIMTGKIEKSILKIGQALSAINLKDIGSKIINFISKSFEASRIQANAELQLNVVLNNKGLGQQFDEIKKKAEQLQSIGFFKDEVILAGTAKLATYLKRTEEIKKMMDILANYATGMSGGKEVNAKQMTQYATTLTRMLNGSFIDLTRSGLKFNDAQKAIIKGIATESQYIQVLGKDYNNLSEEMRKVEVIGQVINKSWGNLYGTMSNTPFGKWEQLKNIFSNISEEIGNRLVPAVNNFMDAILQNMPNIKDLIFNITEGLSSFIATISPIITGVISFFSKLSETLKQIAPEFFGVFGVIMAIYLAVMSLINVINFLMSPIGLVILAITGISLVLAVVIKHINKTKNKSISAVGVIAGVFYSLWTVVKNVVGRIWDIVATVIEFLVNCWENPEHAGKAAFSRLLQGITNILADIVSGVGKAATGIANAFATPINGVIDAWNKTVIATGFGSLVSRISPGSANSVVDKTVSNIRKIADKYGEVADEEERQMNAFKLPRIEQKSIKKAYEDAYNWGKSLSDSFNNNAWNKMPGIIENIDDDFSNDFADKITDNTGKVANNTGAINNKLNVMEDDLKYLRDFAEREIINNVITSAVNVEMINNNNINSELDIDGVLNTLTKKLEEQLSIQVAGVYNY